MQGLRPGKTVGKNGADTARRGSGLVGRITSGERSLSQDRFVDRAARAAGGLARIGIGANDAVALLLRNDIAFLEASRAASMLGAFSVPINWHLSGAEVAFIIEDSGARVLVVHADLLPALAPSLPAGLTVLIVATPPEIAEAYGIPAQQCAVPVDQTDWDAWVDAEQSVVPVPVAPPAAIIYTSGTTGRPKGVRRNPADAETLQRGMTLGAFVMDLRPDARTMITGPMYHAAPNVYAQAMVAVGAEVWLEPKFDAEELLAAIETHRLTHLNLVPLMFVRLLKLPEAVRRKYDVSSLRHVVHAAAPCPIDIKRQMIEWWGPVLTEYYGSTETGAVVHCTAEEWLAHPGTVGRALPHSDVLIIGDNGEELPRGEIGEIFARNHSVADFSYSGAPEKRGEIDREGLITSGDVGYLDADGFLFLCDRRKDMVISGGVNIYPAEIESALVGHPGVADCAVFGIPDEEFGEALAAVVQMEPGATLSAAQVRDYLRERIARYKVPKLVEFASELPREDTGKIFKRKLRDPYWAAAGRSI